MVFKIKNDPVKRTYGTTGARLCCSRNIGRPNRQGKEAIFMFRQLIQLVAARHLIDANWPLEDIEREFRGQTTEVISKFIPGSSLGTDADDTTDLIDQFRKEAGYGLEDARHRLRRRKIDQARQQVDISSALRNIGSDLSNVIKEEFTAFQLATWMILFVDQSKAASLTIEQAEQIGRSITAALLNPRSLNTRDYQYAAMSATDEIIKLQSLLQKANEELEIERETRNFFRAADEVKKRQSDEIKALEAEVRYLKENLFNKEKKDD